MIYKTALEELEISNQRRSLSDGPSVRKLQKKNKSLQSSLEVSKKMICKLRELTEEKYKKMESWKKSLSSLDKRFEMVEEQMRLVQVKLAFNASELKESMNLFEAGLGEEVTDREVRKLQKKLGDKKEELAIAERNISGLNKLIDQKVKENKALEEELENRPAGGEGFEEVKELRVKVKELETKKQSSEEQVVGIQKRFKIMYSKNKELNSQVVDLEDNMEALEKNIAELRRVKEEKDKIISDFEKRVKAGGLEEGDAVEMEKKLMAERELELAQEDQEVKRLKSLLREKDDELMAEQGRTTKVTIQLEMKKKELKNWQIRWNLHENRALQAIMRAGRSSPQNEGNPNPRAMAMAANHGFSFREMDVKGLKTSLGKSGKVRRDSDSNLDNQVLPKDITLPSPKNGTDQSLFSSSNQQAKPERARASSKEDQRGNYTINIKNLTVQTVKYLSHGAPKVEGIGEMKESNSEDNLIGHRENSKKRKTDFKSDFEGTFQVNSREINRVSMEVEEFSLDNLDRKDLELKSRTKDFLFNQTKGQHNNMSLGGEGLTSNMLLSNQKLKDQESDFEQKKKQSGVGLFKNEEEEVFGFGGKKDELPGFGDAFEPVNSSTEQKRGESRRRPNITQNQVSEEDNKSPMILNPGKNNFGPRFAPVTRGRPSKNPKMMLMVGGESNSSDESSSLGSLIQSRSNNNSKENNSIISGKRKLTQNPVNAWSGSGGGNVMSSSVNNRNGGETSQDIRGEPTGKSSGNLIMTGNSIISVVSASDTRASPGFEEEESSQTAKITKSLFVSKSHVSNYLDPKLEGGSSNSGIEQNFNTGGSDFDGLFFEAKKEEDSDVFSVKEENVFENDENIIKMMEHEAALPGMTVETFSRRYIDGETDTEKEKAVKKQVEEVQKKLDAQKQRATHMQNLKAGKVDKNLFDQSFNQSFQGLALNGSGQQKGPETIQMYPRVPKPAPGGHVDHSFGGDHLVFGGDTSFGPAPGGFGSGTSFGTGGQILDEDLMKEIKRHDAMMTGKNTLSNSGISLRNKSQIKPLETVMEEEFRIEAEFTGLREEAPFVANIKFSNAEFMTIKNTKESRGPVREIGESQNMNFFTDQVDLGAIMDGLNTEKSNLKLSNPLKSLVTSEVFDEDEGEDEVKEDKSKDNDKDNNKEENDKEEGGDYDFGARLQDSFSDSDGENDLFAPKMK